jgi:hypothetical protein
MQQHQQTQPGLGPYYERRKPCNLVTLAVARSAICPHYAEFIQAPTHHISMC